MTIDQVLQSSTPAPIVQEGTAVYYRIGPIDGTEKNNDMNDDTVDATKDLYPAIVSATAEMVKMPSALHHILPESNKKTAQYQYTLKCDNASAVQHVFERNLATPANVTWGELLALSPDYRRYNVDYSKVSCTAAYSLSPQLLASLPTTTSLLITSVPVTLHLLWS